MRTVPTFCRHNRFLERCPVCSKTLPGVAVEQSRGRSPSRSAHARPSAGAAARGRTRAEGMRVRREQRAEDDGFRSTLLPGLRASADARRLAEEIAFARGRLLKLGSDPPGLYHEARALAEPDIERATWTCFLIAYLSPLEGPDPFHAINEALRAEGLSAEDLLRLELGPRSSHDSVRGSETIEAYRSWIVQSGSQRLAFAGEPSWSPQRRFERLFERLALPGLNRAARFELLMTLGVLGVYEIEADSLHLAGSPALAASDPATMAAKRVFAIGDPLNLERRAARLAEAIELPVGVLDLALANWISPQPATLGVSSQALDREALERVCAVLGL